MNRNNDNTNWCNDYKSTDIIFLMVVLIVLRKWNERRNKIEKQNNTNDEDDVDENKIMI